MKSRSPVPCIISLVCGCIGIFFGMLALIYAVMGGMEYNSYYVMIMDDEVYESCYKACLFFSSVTAALEAAAVTLGLIGIIRQRRVLGCAIAGLSLGCMVLIPAVIGIINAVGILSTHDPFLYR